MNKDQTNLTQGGVTKQLIHYSIPMVISSLLQALYSMADIIIAGNFIGSNGISAINNASQVMGIITNIAIGITVGGNIIVGQFFGSADHRKQKEASGTMFTVSMLAALGITALILLLADPILVALGAPALSDASDYLSICALGMPFIFGYNALSAILRAVGNSKQPLYFIAAATTANVLLDLLFVGVFQWGTAGAAAATVLAQALSFFLALFYLIKRKELFELRRDFLKVRWTQLRLILKVGIPCSLQMTIAGFSWLVVTFLINQYGVNVSAGNGVSIKIKDFCQLFIAAMANSAATMIAQTLGAKLYDRAKSVMYAAMRITLLMAVVLIVIVELFAPQLAAIFTQDPKVAAAAVLNLRIEIVGQLFYAVFLVYHALAIGAGHTTFAMASSFVNCIVFRVILATTLNHFFGLTGLYLACTIAPSSSIPLGYLYTKSNVWRRSFAQSAGDGEVADASL